MNIDPEELDELQVKLAKLGALSPESERDTLVYELLCGYWRVLSALVEELL